VSKNGVRKLGKAQRAVMVRVEDSNEGLGIIA
jgi:hypothetical protein